MGPNKGVTSMSARQVSSLQDQCRRSILARLSIRHVQQVARLPLPNVVKDFLTTFRIPDDFDLTGMYIDYNFNFPFHLHHHSHQVHPAVCSIDKSEVLIKCLSAQPCKLCFTDHLDFQQSEKKREKWAGLRHKNLQNCLISRVENVHNMVCYVLEFPLLTLEDYAYKVFLSGNAVPEFLVWEALLKLTSVFLYLESEKTEAWDLCQPNGVVINNRGEIKLENLLLYLPARKPQRQHWNAGATTLPPEGRGNVTPRTIVWSIGNVISHLTAPLPAALVNAKCVSFDPTSTVRSRYTRKLQGVLAWCMQEAQARRPSLKKLKNISRKTLKEMRSNYTGPRNLLQLVSADHMEI